MKPVLYASPLDVGYDRRTVVGNIHFEAYPGQMICLIGPNGAGKSTILRTLSGLQPPVQGKVLLNDKDINRMKKGDLARKMALVLTDNVSPGLMTAFEMAALGRQPHTNFFGSLKKQDIDIIEQAMETVNAIHLADRYFADLSDGEKQKVLIARALVQQPEVIVLDEPTSHLDIKHKVEVLQILGKLCRETGITVVVSLHDIDIAIKCCHQLLLIKENQVIAQGRPDEVISSGTVQDLYGIEGAKYNELLGSIEVYGGGAARLFAVAGGGSGIGLFRALSREGVGFACGVLQPFDIDAQVASALGAQVIESRAFHEICEADCQKAWEIMEDMDIVVDTGFPIGTVNSRNLEIISKAVAMGKEVYVLRECEETYALYGRKINVHPEKNIGELLFACKLGDHA